MIHLLCKSPGGGAGFVGAPYKWAYVGGSTLFSEITTAETTNSGTFVDLTTVGPSITTPLAGSFFVENASLVTSNSNSGFGYLSYSIGAAAASNDDQVGFQQPTSGGANAVSHVSRKRVKTLAANDALVTKYKSNGAGIVATFQNRSLALTPIRVG